MTTVTIAVPRLFNPSITDRRIHGISIVAARRLALSIRSPRALLVPLLAPVLFALVVAPALANAVASGRNHTTYMTFVALATAGLLIPLSSMFSGLGVVVDRQHGAMRELLVAPIRRSSIVLGNMAAAVAVTSMQLAVLIGAADLRGASFESGGRLIWFFASAILFSALMYGLAEIMATRLDQPEEYIAAVPAIAIVPFFFAGSLYPIISLPHWLTYIARVLPLTHALALFRYGLTGVGSQSGGQALRNIWGMNNEAAMAALSLLVVVVFAVVIVAAALRLFARAGSS